MENFSDVTVSVLGPEICHEILIRVFEIPFGKKNFNLSSKFWTKAGIQVGDLTIGYFKNSKLLFEHFLMTNFGEHVLPFRIKGEGDYYIFDDDLYFEFYNSKYELAAGLASYRGVKSKSIENALGRL